MFLEMLIIWSNNDKYYSIRRSTVYNYAPNPIVVRKSIECLHYRIDLKKIRWEMNTKLLRNFLNI